MKQIKDIFHSLLKGLGYKLINLKYNKARVQTDAFDDMKLSMTTLQPCIFDIGANTGQTTTEALSKFPSATVYAFEPGEKTYLELSSKFPGNDKVFLKNAAVGSSISKMKFFENEFSDMSSFLEIDRAGWGAIKNEIVVDVVTVDHYCSQHKINYIDILKSDTQGFELEVFKGAVNMMQKNRIQFVYFEFTFSDMYKGLPPFDVVFQLLVENNFRLVNLYNLNMQDGMLGWADLLFVSTKFSRENDKSA